MEYLSSVIIFSISASITPGPNTIMAMASGLNFGFKKSLPLLFGICIGFAAMLFLVGTGFGQVFERFPRLTICIKLLGIGYLLYLAFLIAKSTAIKSFTQYVEPLSFQKGVLFQWVNAKAWVVCVSAVMVFTTPGEHYLSQTLTLTMAFLLVGPPCVAVWVMSGTFLKSRFRSQKLVRRLNYCLSALLVASILPVVNELIADLT